MHNQEVTSERDFAKTPIFMVSSFVGALRQYFSGDQRIAIEKSSYLWDEDPTKTKVLITQSFSPERDGAGKRPSIVVAFPQKTFVPGVLGDGMGFYPKDGREDMLNLIQGQMTFTCVSDKALGAEELATEVAYFLRSFRTTIQCALGLDKMMIDSMAGPTKMEEYKEYWASTVNMSLNYQDNFSLLKEGLKIKSIRFTFTEK